jgi:hypothetical protein
MGERLVAFVLFFAAMFSWVTLRPLISQPVLRPYMHAPLSIAALEAGKHVLCEARMAMNASEARAMLATARRHPTLVAQLVPSPITLAFDATIQDILRSGK